MLAACSRSKGPAVAAQAPAGNPEPVASSPSEQPPVTAQVPEEDSAPGTAPPVVRQLVIPRGTHLHVRLDEELDTRRNRVGDRFTASLHKPVILHGDTVLPAGTRFHGHLVAAKPSGRLKGRAVLGLTLDSFERGGRRYPVDTHGDYRESRRHRRRNLAFMGGGSGGGAAIGAVASGGVGAAIGALAGGGAGLAGAVFTGRKQVAVAAESTMTFTLRAPVTM